MRYSNQMAKMIRKRRTEMRIRAFQLTKKTGVIHTVKDYPK